MPLYEYRCNQCGRTFEKMVRFGQDEPHPACPGCNSDQTQKKISIFANAGTDPRTSGSGCGPASGGGRFT